MKRRSFLSIGAATSTALYTCRAFGGTAAQTFHPSPDSRYQRLLILVELKGGNDGLNTVIPFADPAYFALRKNLAIQRGQVIQLDERTALHPSLLPLMPLWRSRELAIVQGVGYAQPNLSHFRSTEIWDTASRADQYLREGWLTRAFAHNPVPATFVADGAVLGSVELGPLANGARALMLRDSMRYFNASRPDTPKSSDAATHRTAPHTAPHTAQQATKLHTVFPSSGFGAAIETAMRALTPPATQHRSNGREVAVIRFTLNGFDTHENQQSRHATLLTQLADGLASLKAALVELGRWERTLVLTYAEFGRSPRENQKRGTDHGTVASHFVMGARVRGGLYGVPPSLARLDGNGNLPHGVDFRQLYATVLDRWWGIDSTAVLQQRFEPLPLLRV